jgi:DnaK suppressor protein
VAKPKAKASAHKAVRPATPTKKKPAGKSPATGTKKPAAKPGLKKPVAKTVGAKSPPKHVAKPAQKAVSKSVPKAKTPPVRPAGRKAVAKKSAVTAKTVAKPTVKVVPTVKAVPANAGVAKAVPAKAGVPKPVTAKASPAKASPAKAVLVKSVPAKATTVPAKVTPPAPVKAVVSAPSAPPADKKSKSEPVKKAAQKPAAKAASPVRKVINLDEIKLPSGYRPSANEEYMCPQHLAYFKQKLSSWRQELILESQETLEHLRTETRDVGDEAERASRESDNILELRTRDRYRKLLNKIVQALKRIEEGAYGYCEETGEEIGLGRLEARPIATLTVDAQERRELFQRQFRDDH